MAAPAGPCEWCGGPQNWTIHAGEMYVRCVGGCLPLPLEGLVLPPGCELPEKPASAENGTLPEEGVVPQGGGDAKTSETEVSDLPF